MGLFRERVIHHWPSKCALRENVSRKCGPFLTIQLVVEAASMAFKPGGAFVSLQHR